VRLERKLPSTPLADLAGDESTAAYLASAIDSATGAPSATGDIPVAETHVSAMRTLGIALGIPEDKLASSFTAAAGGKVVRAAVTGV
jgi:hypothetical protein